MAESVRLTAERIMALPTAKNDTRAITRGILEAMSIANFYECDAISDAVDQMFEVMFDGKDASELKLDQDCRLPSEVCGFWSKGTKVVANGHPDPLPMMYLAVQDKGRVFVYLVSPYMSPLSTGNYIVGPEGGVFVDLYGNDEDAVRRVTQTLTVAAVCSVINQPGFTKVETTGSRQERRAATRSGGYAPDAWHRITWNIGEEVKAKLTRDEPVRCMPLHYTRGHWRKAQPEWNGATKRKDGAYYQWIDGYWSGHPAFGIRKAYHAPVAAAS
ncbi:MAG: hypothetical protein EBR82_50115 [Caulobacteraceae bacterium]|nr:hypothetical protein [Caulobacteraceae bacterium]